MARAGNETGLSDDPAWVRRGLIVELADARRYVSSEGLLLGGAWCTTASCPAFPLHMEEELELNLVVNGTLTVFANRERYRASRGDLVWLRPGYLRGVLECSADMVMWVISARARAAETARFVDSNFGTGHAAELVHLGRDAFRALSKRCFALLRAQREPCTFNALLEEFLVAASTAVTPSAPPSDELHYAVEHASALLATPYERQSLFDLPKRVQSERPVTPVPSTARRHARALREPSPF